MNPAHRAGCEMCGENRYSTSDDAESKAADAKYVRERSRLQQEGTQKWIRRMDEDNVIRWARTYDPESYQEQLGGLEVPVIGHVS